MPDAALAAAAIVQEFVALQRALAGRYSLERELGRGGMGIVFLARDVTLDRPVALKLLPPAMAAQPTLRQRFLREAQTAAKLSHPNIIPIFSVDEVGDFVFFVMAYVEGETLGYRLQARGPLTPAEGTRMIQEVAWALAYAHLRGIVHRDVKPDNILLEQATGRALVSDFGIARATDASGGTAVGEILGTAHYMSPEQACGESLDGRSDLYSLGVVAFYALCGKLPFDAPDVPALLAMQITRPAPPLATVTPGIPGKLAQAVDRCLAKDPAERFQTGEALAEAIASSTAIVHETPAPIRVWLTKGETLRVALWPWSALMGFAFTVGLVSGHGSVGPLLYIVGPWSAFAVFRLYQTQRVLAAGYGLDDLRLALREHAERRREERAFDYDRDPPLAARVIRGATFAALGTTVVSFVLAYSRFFTFDVSPLAFQVFGWSAFATVSGLAIGRIYPGKRISARDSGVHRRLKLWTSRAGEWLARLVRIGLKRSALPPAAGHRPTEIAIGLAADALFEALPRETRKLLKDLPAVVRRLEAEAQGLRARVDELNAMMAGAGDESVAARSTSLQKGAAHVAGTVADNRQRVREELQAQRDAVASRLAISVAALENIRLDLLRLKAGSGTVDQISADLTAARKIGVEIDAALAGQREVEGLLAAPAPDPPPARR
jgi:hypothetical protein